MNISGLSQNPGGYAQAADPRAPSTQAAPAANGVEGKSAPAADGKPAGTNVQPKLSAAELEQIRQLKLRDAAVRRHELAHLAASGGLALSAAIYTYQRGPDGISYAVGGEAHIDLSAGLTPEATIARARIVEAAALASADPSAQDRAVAIHAQQMELEAQIQLAQQAIVGPAQGKDQKAIGTLHAAYAATGKASSVAGSINSFA